MLHVSSIPRWFYRSQTASPPILDLPAVEVKGLCVAHSGESTLAVDTVSFAIPSGQLVALIGPNGAGKSSLLKSIAGLIKPRSGAISIFGHSLVSSQSRVAYLPQRGEIDWRFPISVRDLVLTGRYVHVGWLHRPDTRDQELVSQVLRRLDLTELADRQIGELSGGQQQRVLLARALVQGSDLLLLDEPFNAVDSANREAIALTLRELQGEGKTALVATHELDSLSAYFDRAISMRDGHLV